MKKLLFAFICLLFVSVAEAQEMTKVTIASVSAPQNNNTTESAAKVIDGDYSNFWHSPWQSGNTTFPVTMTLTLSEEALIDVVRYVPRQDSDNGRWEKVEVLCSTTPYGYTSLGTYDLSGKYGDVDFAIGERCKYIQFKIEKGQGGWATAAEIEAYTFDRAKENIFKKYFADDLFTELKSGITSSNGITDADVKALVDNLLAYGDGYKKFRVAEYEPYRPVSSLQKELKTSSQYNKWENPTGVYLKPGEACYAMVSGIKGESVGIKIKNWVVEEGQSSYPLHNGLNYIEATTEGNLFVDYYTDNYQTAGKVKIHFINAPVRGYWDQETMTNADWQEILGKFTASNDSTIIIARSKHGQVAYPVFAWKRYCPENIDGLMTLYQQVQWAERDIMGLEKFNRQTKNRQLYYATKYGFMAAGGDGSYCNVANLSAIMIPDSKVFDFWGVGHEWGHNNQITPGFKWTGCGETTNNIYASWAQFHFTGKPSELRLENEYCGVGDYSGMRGGRMQAYLEEGVRKGVQWQLQDGPDYHGSIPEIKNVIGKDADGGDIGMVTTSLRNYDHFVKLVPFWQLNLWGTSAGKCPDIIPMVIEKIRTTDNYAATYNTNGKEQINWMKMACDVSEINLLPFFEKAGMLKPINAYIADYSNGWNVITQQMIDELKSYVKEQEYREFTEEINYINGHNYTTYRDKKELSVPSTLGSGCELSGDKVKVQHSYVQNAVAFETYNNNDELVRITMYGLGSDDDHSYTMVLYPQSVDEDDAAAYIMAVGYDGERKKIYEKVNVRNDITFCTITSINKGNALTCGSNTTVDANGNITWDFNRASQSTSYNFIWQLEERGGKIYLYNPQSDSYFAGENSSRVTKLSDKSSAHSWDILCIDDNGTYIFNKEGTDQFMNSYDHAVTGLYGGGASDRNNLWKVEEIKSINVTIGSSGYMTACYPFAVEMPEGVDAYVITGTETNKGKKSALMNKIKGRIIPARMPVLLNAAQGTYTFSLVADDATPYTTPNILKGTTLKRTGVQSGTTMWNIAQEGVLSLSNYDYIPANKAYLLSADIDATQLYFKYIPVENITLGTSSLTLEKGEVATITAKITPSDATEHASWTSSNPSVATVVNGVVTAVSAGTATITAQAESCTAICEVVVLAPIESITLIPSSMTLEKGETAVISVVITPDDATEDVVWSSSDENIVTVDNGVVKGISAGTATITAQSENCTAECEVTVVIPVTGIEIDFSSMAMEPGETRTLTVSIIPDNATDVSADDVIWTSSDGDVVTVEDGVVTAVAEGSAVITAKIGDLIDECVVTVQENIIPVTDITLNIRAKTLEEGETVTIKATVTPEDATDKGVSWKSSDSFVATVVDGVVTAVSEGEATITAKAGACTATCKITVEKKYVPVTGIVLDQSEMTIVLGETGTLVVSVVPSDAMDTNVDDVRWSSSNSKVAKVTDGVVTALAIGTATITARKGTFKATCVVTVEDNFIAVTGITLDFDEMTITEGETVAINATVYPDDATDAEITWSSSDTSVATVADGVVTAVSEGTATITAEAGECAAMCEITVEKKIIAVTGITLDFSSVTVIEGDTVAITATVTPDDATDKSVIWSSSKPSVATVEDGLVVAVAPGAAVITAEIGEYKAKCVVRVEAKSGIDQLQLEIGEIIIYDLDGLRIIDRRDLKRGIYIINGVKRQVR